MSIHSFFMNKKKNGSNQSFSQRISITKELWPYFHAYRMHLIMIFFVKLSLIVPELLYPIVYRRFVDTVLMAHQVHLLVRIILLFLLLYLLETVLKVVHRIFDNFLFNSISSMLKEKMFHQYMYMPIEKFETFTISDLKNRIDIDVDMVKIFILNQVFSYVITFIKLICSTVLLTALDWRFGIFSIVMVPLSVLISNSFRKTLDKKYEEIKRQDNTLEQIVQESLQQWPELKANNLVDWASQKYATMLNKQYGCVESVTNIQIKHNILLKLKDVWINQMLLYILGALLFLVNGITIGTIVMAGQYYNNLYNALDELLKLNVELAHLNPAIKHVLEILSIKVHSPWKHAYMPQIDNQHPIIRFNNLFFKYSHNSTWIFRNFNLTIMPHDKVLILGTNGVGKSTLINLLTGHLTPRSGEVIFGECNIQNLERHYIYSQMAILYQENYYMDITIKEFLLLANPHSNDSQIRSVCSRVGLLTYIEQLPDKFNTKLGKNGSNLSGGEKQRLSIARLLLTDKEIVILDESFSAIDRHDKLHLLQEILDEFRHKTILCISHDEELYNMFDKQIRLS